MAFKLPAGMSTLEGALIEPLAVGFHAVGQAEARIGQSAVVLGAGCIGLATMMALKAMGITDVYISDLIPKRLEMAKRLGATKVFKGDDVDVTEEIMKITEGRGVDLVFETAGNKFTTQQTVQLVKPGGRIVLVGLAPEGIMPFDIGQLMSKEASVNTVFRYRNLYPAAIKAVAAGLIPLKDIVTNTYKFDEIPEALEYSIKNKADIVKSTVIWWRSHKHYIRAQVIFTCFAEFALATGVSRLQCHQVPNLDICYSLANFYYFSTAFMTENHRILYNKISNSPMLIIM
jgi:L-iditol 2-dehydrogenase